MNNKIVLLSFLVLFCSWSLPGAAHAGSGAPDLRPSAPESSHPSQNRNPIYPATPKSSPVIVEDNEKNDAINEKTEEEKKTNDAMREDAEELEKQLKVLKGGKGE